ncbi:GNAT family N-acetyltransferase [Lysobacter korlensis]|uniref:GNAT family N-acetyltransferase n=1 Tax=Lysobacter korlensis TaxID=553636 RepID=A0ABV6RWB3_9GAMM
MQTTGLPVIDRRESWPRRRRLYDDILTRDGAFALVARMDGRAVGYAIADERLGPDDTWPTSDRIGEIHSLVVLREARGLGIGTALLDAAEARLYADGAATVLLEVVVGNESARDFYARRGMVTTLTTMLRIGPRQ